MPDDMKRFILVMPMDDLLKFEATDKGELSPTYSNPNS